MTPSDFAAALARLGYSQAAFGRLIDYRPNQVSRWARGHGPVPVVVAEYLSLRLEVEDLRAQVAAMADRPAP